MVQHTLSISYKPMMIPYLQVSVVPPSFNVTVVSASPPFFGVMGLGYVQMGVMILDAVSYYVLE